MKVWRRASGALKDKNSIWIASIGRRSKHRNPDLESAIIKATSHDESCIDYKNAQRVFAWIRTSPTYIRPLIWALSVRMEKTRNWVVALKGLLLMHGIFCCKIPAVQRIGRLPFDLSNFTDEYLKPGMAWRYSTFVRSYFAFLDQRSALLCTDFIWEHNRKGIDESIGQEIEKLQKWQSLLDILLQIRPHVEGMRKMPLILEAMDCVIIEIFDVYSRICRGIASVLMKIYTAGKVEAAMALKVVQKSIVQGEKLSLYFEFCKEFGVLNAMECPKVERIPEADIRDLEKIINGVSEDQEKDLVVRENGEIVEYKQSNGDLKTIITNKWEVFDEDLKGNGEIIGCSDVRNFTTTEDPFAAPPNLLLPLVPVYSKQEIPDLISL